MDIHAGNLKHYLSIFKVNHEAAESGLKNDVEYSWPNCFFQVNISILSVAPIEGEGLHMYLETGLEILVKEWMELTCNGQTNLSLAEVVEKLGGDNWRGINGQLTPGQVAELIEEDMRRLGVLDNAETFMSRFRTEDELLAETSLYDLIRDFGVPQQYRRQPDEYQGQQA